MTRQWIGRLARADRSFPVPVTHRSGGSIWYAAGIEIWIASHRPADRGASGRFGEEAARILRAAEALAARHEHGYVGEGHLVAAMAEVEGLTVLEVFASLGVDRAELLRATGALARRPDPPSAARRMNPFVQQLLSLASARAEPNSKEVAAEDIVIGLIDGDENRRGRRRTLLLDYLERRGLEIDELRSRLVAARDDQASITSFERRKLPKRRPADRRRKRPPGVEYALNPLRHDPSKLSSGAAFAGRKDGRLLVIDGEQWFFRIDGDGFFVRTPDGRPVGYRYRVDPPPGRGRGNPRPVNGFEEVLPMPPDDVADWPDHRFEPET